MTLEAIVRDAAVWAPLGAAGYFGLSLALGDVFPFSTYCMYSVTANRRAASVPVFLADGRQAPFDRYRDFTGIDLERLRPPPETCSLEWRAHELRQWLAEHRSPGDRPAGPVRVEVAYQLLAFSRDGRLLERQVVVARGRAWPA